MLSFQNRQDIIQCWSSDDLNVVVSEPSGHHPMLEPSAGHVVFSRGDNALPPVSASAPMAGQESIPVFPITQVKGCGARFVVRFLAILLEIQYQKNSKILSCFSSCIFQIVFCQLDQRMFLDPAGLPSRARFSGGGQRAHAGRWLRTARSDDRASVSCNCSRHAQHSSSR